MMKEKTSFESSLLVRWQLVFQLWVDPTALKTVNSVRCVELLLFLHGPSDRFKMKARNKIPSMDRDEGEDVV